MICRGLIDTMKGMIGICGEKCRWCPLIVIVGGILLFLLGYYLDAKVVRILWLVTSALWVAMGLGSFIMLWKEK